MVGNFSSDFVTAADDTGLSYTMQVTDKNYSNAGVNKGTKNWMKVTTDLSSSFMAQAQITNYMYQLSKLDTTYVVGRVNKNDHVLVYFPDLGKEITSKVYYSGNAISNLNRTFNAMWGRTRLTQPGVGSPGSSV